MYAIWNEGLGAWLTRFGRWSKNAGDARGFGTAEEAQRVADTIGGLLAVTWLD